MGTVLELTLVSREPDRARERLRAEHQQVAALDLLLSRHSTDSELSRINMAAISPDNCDYLAQSIAQVL